MHMNNWQWLELKKFQISHQNDSPIIMSQFIETTLCNRKTGDYPSFLCTSLHEAAGISYLYGSVWIAAGYLYGSVWIAVCYMYGSVWIDKCVAFSYLYGSEWITTCYLYGYVWIAVCYLYGSI